MSPQLTLQTPVQIPPTEIPRYLEKLWSNEQNSLKGANTFCLLIWQPAWIEQKLVTSGQIKGPILGNQRQELIETARQTILEKDLPHSTPPLDRKVKQSIEIKNTPKNTEDLRGQHIDSAISNLKPRRLITLAPTIEKNNQIETLIAAYCPLPEEGGGNSACGDVVVIRGGQSSLSRGLNILDNLTPKELPSWLWWNGEIDEAPDLFEKLAEPNRRLIIDTAIGEPLTSLRVLSKRIASGQAVNDLNWLRLRTWRETLAMVFDPLHRRDILNNVVNVDIDIQGSHPVQGLLLAGWIADRLNWELQNSTYTQRETIEASFIRPDKTKVNLRLTSLPIGHPSIHPGQIVGLRLISKTNNKPQKDLCVILASESGECMRLEAGGMASMELVEQVVPIQKSSLEMDVARLLSSSRGSSSPLLASAVPISTKLLEMTQKSK